MKAVIIEDETLVARELQAKIKEIADDIEIVAVLPSLKTAKNWFMQNAEPDLMFMDIQLGDGISFELFTYYQLSCSVIFTTAYDEYAIRAFKVNSVDYLLKPVDEAELKQAIDKCRQKREQQLPQSADITQLFQQYITGQRSAPVYKENFIVSMRHQWVPVKTDDIAFFAKEHLMLLNTLNGEKHVLDFNSLDEIEELLDPKKFYRANRQYIVNVDAIARVRLLENQKLSLILKSPIKTQIDISREKAPLFKKWFDR